MILVERKRANPPNVTRALTQSGGLKLPKSAREYMLENRNRNR